MKKHIKIVIVAILILAIIISLAYLIKNNKEDKEQEEIYEEIITIAEDTEEIEEDSINLEELYEINSDIVGWIKIDDTNINYPVMQNKNNYYLHRNFYKQYSSWGTPYIAESCSIENSDSIIIYGHHISQKRMFGELENYKNIEYYKEHEIIKFYTLQEQRNYEIISVFKTVVYSDKGFKYYTYINFNNEKEFDTFINESVRLSFYDTGKTVNYGDKILMLSTCEYSNTNGRLVIVAKMIDSEEG